MTYIRELIHIPDHVGRGDFVLRLSEGITDPEGTVRHYQVTPQLVGCFDEALNLVKSSLHGGAGGRTTPISPPSGPAQWLVQGPPAESKLLAARRLSTGASVTKSGAITTATRSACGW